MDLADITNILEATVPRNHLPKNDSLGLNLLYHQRHLERIPIIEIGSASTPLLSDVFSMNIPFHVGIDPFYEHQTKARIATFLHEQPVHEGKLSTSGEDAFVYLEKQPSESATVVSIGVLDSFVIGYDIHNDPIMEEYRQELCQQIYRLTQRGGFSFHCAADSLWSSDLRKAGFKSKGDNDTTLWK